MEIPEEQKVSRKESLMAFAIMMSPLVIAFAFGYLAGWKMTQDAWNVGFGAEVIEKAEALAGNITQNCYWWKLNRPDLEGASWRDQCVALLVSMPLPDPMLLRLQANQSELRESVSFPFETLNHSSAPPQAEPAAVGLNASSST